MIYEKKKSDKQEFWQKHVRAWKASGMTQAEYCRIHGLKDHRLTYYKLRFETFSNVAKGTPGKMVSKSNKLLMPVKFPSPSVSTIQVTLAGGTKIEFSDGADPVWIGKVIGSIDR